MAMNSELDSIMESPETFLPSVSVDCVVFGFSNHQLKILLLKYKEMDYWALPGGFVKKEEDIDQAVHRVLKNRTGLQNIYLQQFASFGKKDRENIVLKKAILSLRKPVRENSWLLNRFISIGYYALVDFSKVSPSPDDLSDACQWHDIDTVPHLLIHDHHEIIRKALEDLQLMLDYKLVGFNLLPETFTMAELQSLYETVLGKKLLRTNFQRKMLSLGILERIEKQFTGAAHKAPYLYKFIPNK
jgi:8-oxo-dGTP diphosphatase